jgi:hypothetical protein
MSLVQTYVLVCSNGYMRDYGTYTPVCSADIGGVTTRRMLTNNMPYFVNSTWTYTQKYWTYVTFWIDH